MGKEKNEMTRNAPGVLIYHDNRDQLEMLSHEERGILLLAVLDYAKCGESPLAEKLSQAASIVYSFLCIRIDADTERYNSRCEANAAHYSRYRRAKKAIDGKSGGINLDDFLET